MAGYAAQALARARRLRQRDNVAPQRQQAMRTPLPTVPGPVLAPRYQPADSREDVDGDCYDAIPVPNPDRPDARLTALSIGDVTGHALDAATVRGKSAPRCGRPHETTRQAALAHPRRGRAGHHRHRAEGDRHRRARAPALRRHRPAVVTWTNAGHPPPILLDLGDRTSRLPDHDILFGFPGLAAPPRHDHHHDLTPGSTPLLHTDSLVERRGHDLDKGTDRLRRLLTDNRELATPELVDLAVDTLSPNSADDVIACAAGSPCPTRNRRPTRSVTRVEAANPRSPRAWPTL